MFYACFHNIGIRSLWICPFLTVTNDNAFYGLKSLEEITIIGDISEIGYYTFGECSGLKRLTIYDRDVEISEYADIPSSTTIYSYTNSSVQKYASANNLKFVSLDDSEGLLGDCNNDGKVTVEDAIMLEQWLLGAGNLTNWHNADLCKDGEIDVFDMVEMRKLLS